MHALFRLPLPLRAVQAFDFPKKLGVCERLFGNGLSQHGISWIETAAGVPWKLDLRNATHRWIVYGKYEGAPFLDWAKKFLPPDGIIVDSGANIGQMLLYLGQWVPHGRVLAIEPGKHQADWLEECLSANPKLPVTLLRVGLGDVGQKAFLEEAGAADRHGSWNRVSETRGESIEIVRLDDVLRERQIEKVDLWKLDVEGSEVPALAGAEGYLTDHRIRSLYVELRGGNGREIRRHLKRRGYDCFLFAANGRLYQARETPEEDNGLFLPVKGK